MARLSEKLKSGVQIGCPTRSTDLKSNKINECRLQPVSRPTRLHKSGGSPVARAVHSFVQAMADEVGADDLAFRLLRSSYTAWAREHGLPALSDIALSRALVEAGCRRRKLDRRKSGQGILVVYSIPEAA